MSQKLVIFSVRVNCGCGLVLHNMLFTSIFVDDVMFSHNGAYAVVLLRWQEFATRSVTVFF